MTLPLYRLHVELRNVEPPVWRVVEVPGHLSLAELHDAALLGLADLDPRRGDTLRYVYDFDDRWDHTVRVKEVLTPSSRTWPTPPY